MSQKIVFHNCFHFTCSSCDAINICDLDKLEMVYICDNCNETNYLTADELVDEGNMISTDSILITGVTSG